jgi:hypothetical protein
MTNCSQAGRAKEPRQSKPDQAHCGADHTDTEAHCAASRADLRAPVSAAVIGAQHHHGHCAPARQ